MCAYVFGASPSCRWAGVGDIALGLAVEATLPHDDAQCVVQCGLDDVGMMEPVQARVPPGGGDHAMVAGQ